MAEPHEYAALVGQYIAGQPAAEQAAIQELREALAADQVEAASNTAKWDDMVLLRILRARDFKVGASVKMFTEILALRLKWGVDTLLTDWQPPEVMLKFYPHGCDGLTHEGNPIFYEGVGDLDVKGLMRSASEGDIVRFALFNGELCCQALAEASIAQQTLVHQISVIADLKGLGWGHMHRSFLRAYTEQADVFETLYPEVMNQIFVVNPPRIFPVAWNIIKPFLAENTKHKIRLLTTDPEKNKTVLLQAIPEDQLPTRFGGALVSPKLVFGATVPDSYFVAGLDGVRLVVPARTCLYAPVPVEAAGTTISVSVQTQAKNIAVGIAFSPVEQVDMAADGSFSDPQQAAALEQCLPVRKLSCSATPEQCRYTAERPGLYLVQFDNTYSWMTPKTLDYTIATAPPASPQRPATNTRVSDL